MGLFANLHDASEVLAFTLGQGTSTAPANSQVGPLIDPATGTAESIRVTLLWVTPQPTHRNDPAERTLTGELTQPPVTVSGFYMVSTYGSTATQNPIRAYTLLGEVLQTFHSAPVLELPADGMGTGRLSVVHVPTAADLMERVYAPLRLDHRPWALFEAGPIQLAHQDDPLAAVPVVRPGGLALGDVGAGLGPTIERVTPRTARGGGLVRLDGVFGGPIDHVSVGGQRHLGAALDLIAPGGPLFVDLAQPEPPDAPLGPGDYDVRVIVAGVPSDPVTLTVGDPALELIDALNPPVHSVANPLVIPGVNLAAADRVFLWPDQAPLEVADLPAVGQPGDVTVAAADLQGAGLGRVAYRLTARVGPHRYTPWVLVEPAP